MYYCWFFFGTPGFVSYAEVKQDVINTMITPINNAIFMSITPFTFIQWIRTLLFCFHYTEKKLKCELGRFNYWGNYRTILNLHN